MSQPNGIEVIVVPPRYTLLANEQSIRVSSTTIRYMLQGGHVADAAALLSRPYRLIGQIVPGRGQGRRIGYPTLNMKMPSQIIPQEGVYAGFVRLGRSEDDVCQFDGRLDAVFSIGRARTFGEGYPLFIEAHLIDSRTGNPTGKWIAMDLVERIRPQYKFKSPSDLAGQIAEDCLSAKQILSSAEKKART
jgi:riboflavin kinase/FMN adenylyltransferase